MSETLAACADETRLDGAVTLQHLLGQWVERLATSIGKVGAFATDGAPAVTALATFRQHSTNRFACRLRMAKGR